MIRRYLSISALAIAAVAADDPWDKVVNLKHGAEIRIYKKGAKEPLVAKFDEADAERVLIVSKDSQMAVAKDDMERLDARPQPKTPPRKSSTSTTGKTTDPDYTPHPNAGVPVPGTSYGSSVSLGSGKAEFETVYRRRP